MGVSNASQLEPGLSGTDQPEETVAEVLQAGTELMILCDGRVLVHNLTPQMRVLLQEVLGGETIAGVSLDADCASQSEQPVIRSI